MGSNHREERGDPAGSGDAGDIFADDRLVHLYSLPLESFIAERDALVRDLRASGRPADGALVRALKRPTLSAWSINQVRRQDPDAIAELIGAGSELQQAQRALLAGGESGHLQEAARAEREAVDRVAEAAGAVLAQAGRPVSGQTMDRIRETLHAAALDDVVRAELERGTVTRDHSAVGLGPLGAAAGVAAGALDRATEEAATRSRGRRGAEAARRREREIVAAEAELEAAKRRAGAAERELRSARRELQRLEQRVRELRGPLG